MSGLINEYRPQKYSLFNFRLTSRNTELRRLAEALVEELGLKTGRLDEVKVALMISILSNLKLGSYTYKCCAISRRPDWYANILPMFKLPIHSFKFVVQALDALVEDDLIVQYLGQHFESGTQELTKIHASDQLSDKLEFLNNSDLEYIRSDVAIELRDKNGRPEEFETNEKIELMENDICDYNKLLEKTEVKLEGLTRGDISDNTDYLLRNTYYNFEYVQDLILRPMSVRRIFNIDFEHGGRFYGGIENMPSVLRPKVTINGLPTVEYDYSSFQLRMLYHLENIDYRKDAYLISKSDAPELREIYKLIALISLNAKDELTCIKGISDELRKSGLGHVIGGNEHNRIKPLLESWRKVHANLDKYFFSGIGLWLQTKESGITNNILKHFLAQGELVLSVHDSYLIQATKGAKLKKAMKTFYRDVLNYSPVIK